VQWLTGTGEQKTLNPATITTATYDVRTDNPYGQSLFYGLPFITEILSAMFFNLGETWKRFGTPTFTVRWKPYSPETFNDPEGTVGSSVVTSVVTSSSSSTDKGNASWTVRAGLANSACVSFESRNTPGSFLRHQNYQLFLHANNGSSLFASDATFCPQAGMNGQGSSFASSNFPSRFIRHYANNVYIASNGGSNTFDATALWADDVSWVVTPSWA